MKYSSSHFLRFFIPGITATFLLVSCNNTKDTSPVTNTSKPTTTASANPSSGKIAYVNLDTLESKYEYFKAKKAAFEQKQASMEKEIESMGRNLQNELATFQKKAQAGTLTQTEGEAAQKKLAGMQENMERRRQSLGEQLMKEQNDFNQELQKRLDNFLVKFNENKEYDFILSYIKGGSILYANTALDITEEVIQGMNKEDQAKPNEPGK